MQVGLVLSEVLAREEKHRMKGNVVAALQLLCPLIIKPYSLDCKTSEAE